MNGMATKLKVALPGFLLLRFLLSQSSLPNLLQDDQQLTSPLTSYSTLREGVYLYENGFDPYKGGVFRQSPLLLAMFSTVFRLSDVSSAVAWTLFDGLGAWCLVEIWRCRSTARSYPKASTRDVLIAALYLFNPYLLLPSLARSTASLHNTLTLLAIMLASKKMVSPAMVALALLCHLFISSVLLVPPILLLVVYQPHTAPSAGTSNSSKAVGPEKTSPQETVAVNNSNNSTLQLGSLLLEVVTYFVVLMNISHFVADGNSWIARTWGTSILLPDFTPNPGLWWYFFTEMFDHFRPFFLMAFSVHLLVYVAPVCIKFSHDPLYAVFVLQGILATFKPYPTLADPGLFASMFAIFPEVFPYLRHPIVTVLLHLHAALLLPLFNSLWLSQGTGNANFYYAVTLVFGLGMAAAVNDAVWAGLRMQMGPKREGWEIVQT